MRYLGELARSGDGPGELQMIFGSVLLGGSSPSVWIDPALPDGGPALAAIGRMLRPFVAAAPAAPGPPGRPA